MIKVTLIVALVLLGSVAVFADATTHTAGWKSFLRQELPILGHRNWIVIADSAYPAQNSAGIVNKAFSPVCSIPALPVRLSDG